MKRTIDATSLVATCGMAVALAMPAQAYTSKTSSWRECTATS